MATNFLLATGTNGFIVTPFDLQSTELNAITTGNTSLSSVGGASGVYSQSDTGHAPQGSIWFSSGGAFTPSAGGHLDGWFMRSSDGGTTFEKIVTNTNPPRAPDFVIPLYGGATAYASGELAFVAGVVVMLPWESFKILVQNNSGVTLPASGNHLKLGPVALQY
jgi:hypothetical protein